MGQGSDQLDHEYAHVSPVDREYDTYTPPRSDDADYRAAAEEIEADIEQTRAQMSDTINQIQERLNPQHLAEQAKEAVYDATIGSAIVTAKGMGSNMFEAIKQNPLPAAIAALSIGWLMRKSTTIQQPYDYNQGQYRPYPEPHYQPYAQSGYRQSSYAARYQNQPASYSNQQSPGIGERVGDMAGNVVNQAQHMAGNVVDQAQDVAGNVVNQAQHMAGNVVNQAQELGQGAMEQAEYFGDQAMEQVEYATDWFQRQMYENPIALGAVALAVGTAVGMTLPATPVENRIMGEARDSLVEKVQETAHDALAKVQTVAAEATQAVEENVKLESREQGSTHQSRI